MLASQDSAIFRAEDTTLNQDQRHPFTRRIDVYVPARYQNGTAAPFLIIQDGPGQLGLIKNALDNLTIESDPARKLPAFVAIAVQNGGSDSKGSERGLEYDTMSDRYARFIQLEVLPAVLADPMIAAAYPELAFTDDPELHKKVEAPILLIGGRADSAPPPERLQSIARTLLSDGKSAELLLVPAGHGFAEQNHPGYSQEASESAWSATVDFLEARAQSRPPSL